MEVIISFVGALAAKAAEYTVGPTARQFSYLFKPKTKFQNLRTKVQDLEDARQRLQQSVEAANRNGEVVFDDVQRWLTEVNERISEEAATQLQEDEERAMKIRCFAGFCPDFMSRYNLGKKADKEADAVTQLLTKKDSLKIVCSVNTVSYLPAVGVMDIIKPVKEYEAFGSRSVAFDRVMAALEDETVRIIGVYGMGGVGKTTLVKEAAKQANEKQLFDEMVLVSIKQKPNMLNIQKEIAEKLGMAICEENTEVRAARLRERLKQRKILVVLDDIWGSLELEALGISSGDEHKGCKMLMTSRRLDVLESLNSQPNISIETLTEHEAWTLFKKMAGIVEGFDFQSTAVEVAKRCAGLPIAIATVAKALKPKQNLYEWKDALRQLSQPSERNFEGISKHAYLSIQLSYKFLDAKELGPIFLLCSILGGDADPEDLLRYAMGLRLIHDVHTMEEARDKVLTLLNNLKASCLLLEGSRPTHFDMHDVVRDVAKSIASRDLHWLTSLKELPDEEKMKEIKLISLQNANVSELLNHELKCPNLEYFSIVLECSSLSISENLFKGMQRLKVLEFVGTKLTALPSSFGCLKTLCTLRLIGCYLEDIIILGELEKLEILDLHGSGIAVLPKEIGQLTRLKLLDLTECFDLKLISPNVLSKLSRLEELYLYHSFDRWEVEGIEKPRSNASLVELQHLSRLTTLEVHIPVAEAIPEDNLFLEKMESFKISIGDEKWHSYYDRGMETSRMLKLKINKNIHLVDGIKPLLEKSQSLYLDGKEDDGEMFYHPNVESFGQLRFIKVKNCSMLRYLFSFSIAKRLCQLEELEVSNCDNIEGLIVENEEIDENDILEFNKLRILKLDKLNRFNSLWYSKNTPQSPGWLFDKKVLCSALEVLVVKQCHKLKSVFTSSTVTSFVHLKTLQVSYCDELEGVIEGVLAATEELISGNIRVFPKLDSLVLEKLPKLSRFCGVINSIEFLSLKSLEIRGCPELNTFASDDGQSRITPLQHLFNEKVSCSVLEELKVKECHKLKHVFTSCMVKSFLHLKTLWVSKCDEMEGVIEGIIAATEEGISSSIRVFPKLDYLDLYQLPQLKRFCCGSNSIEFPSLRRLRIFRCALNTIAFDEGKSRVVLPQYLFNEMVILPVLEVLDIQNMNNLERLWPDQLVEHSFSKLTSISLRGCPKLLHVFPLSMLTRLQRLNRLSICHCASLEEIVFESRPQEGHNSRSAMSSVFPEFIRSNVITFEFSSLTSLALEDLSNLRSIHHKMLTVNWPSLKEMRVGGCDRVETLFASQETSSEQPFFWVHESTFPNLHQLTLVFGWNDGIKKMLWHGEVQQQQRRQLLSPCFPNLKVIKLEQVTALPPYLFRLLSLPNLRTLEISCSSLKEMMFRSKEGDEEKPASLLLSQITELKLDDLPELMRLWKEKEGFTNLRMLHVCRCHKLQVNLVSSLVTFRNLVSLKVEKCNGIIKLITHSTAKTLVQLKEMSIEWCENMEEIIQGGDGDDDEISFPQLNSLELKYLPNLESFCSSENCSFGFPSLKSLLLIGCPKMKKFSQRDSNTSMLRKVGLDRRGYEKIQLPTPKFSVLQCR